MAYNIKNISKYFLVLALILMPVSSFAATTNTETPWGGLHLVTLSEENGICSSECGGGNSHWILDYRTDTLLLLYLAQGQSIIYSNYNTSATYQLGSYSQGGQPCGIYVYEACVYIVNQGTYGMMPGTGTTYVMKSAPSVLASKSDPFAKSHVFRTSSNIYGTAFSNARKF